MEELIAQARRELVDLAAAWNKANLTTLSSLASPTGFEPVLPP
jgi:hypothetical protein